MAAAALVEATAACVGSLISTTFMYPLEVTKTKVQAYGGKSKTSASATGGAKLDAEVLLLLLHIPLFFLLCLPPLPPLPPIVLLLPSNSLQPAVAAAAASASRVRVGTEPAPLMLQVSPEGHHNTMISSMVHTWKTDGYKGLLAPWAPGWAPKLVDAGSFNFCFWFWFTVCTAISKRIGAHGSWAGDTITAFITGVINRISTHPFENIAQRAQCRLPGMPFESMGDACRNIIKESGVRGLWKGLPPALILCINPSINMLCFFRIRRWWCAFPPEPNSTY